jgi:hypothetical protein
MGYCYFFLWFELLLQGYKIFKEYYRWIEFWKKIWMKRNKDILYQLDEIEKLSKRWIKTFINRSSDDVGEYRETEVQLY